MLMNGDANVRLEAVRLLEVAFSRFVSKVLSNLQEPALMAESAMSSLEDHQRDLQNRIDEYEAAAEEEENDEDDEGDGSYYRALAARAQEELDRAERVSARLTDKLASYQRAAQSIEALGSVNAPRGIQTLRGIQLDLLSYLSLEADSSGSFAGSDSGTYNPTPEALPSSTGAGSPEDDPGAGPDPSQFPLPNGFAWIALSDIDMEEAIIEMAHPEAWKKTTREEMLHGFRTLQRTVLSTLKNFGTGIGRDWFASQDRAKGLTYEEGTERVFDAFFGDEPIVLSRRSGSDGPHEITNGRHRISIALELGWSAIPAIFTDQKRS